MFLKSQENKNEKDSGYDIRSYSGCQESDNAESIMSLTTENSSIYELSPVSLDIESSRLRHNNINASNVHLRNLIKQRDATNKNPLSVKDAALILVRFTSTQL